MRTAHSELRHRAAARTAVAACLLATVTGAAPAADDAPPATRPAATAPAAATIAGWVRDLADADPDVRARARVDLMGLDRPGLDTLRQTVAANRPLGPSQAAALQDIVSHVYLATDPSDDLGDREAGGGGKVRGPGGQGGAAGGADEGDKGFLGVQPSLTNVDVSPAPGADASAGIYVVARVPGFCGYRMLEDGDVILRLTSDRPYEFHTPMEFSTTVARQHAGDTITLDVLRRGKVLHVPITLDRKPAWADPLLIEQATITRQRRAADYWDQAFAPLVEGHTS